MKINFICLVVTVSLVCSISADFAFSAQNGTPTLVINEFMASNGITFPDPQREYDDWIEIYNYGNTAINIGGMYLTDDLTDPTRWQFPLDTTISAYEYLVIWADDDINDNGLHANFQLDALGEELGLFDVDGITLLDSVIFDEQTSDVSYGRYPDADENLYFLVIPTPGEGNTIGYQGVIEEPEFSHEHGFYNEPFFVTITSEIEDATIYYTDDGQEPFIYDSPPNRVIIGHLYTGPILIDKTTCLRAIAFKQDWKLSKVATYSYIFLDDVIQQREMDPDIMNVPHYRDNIKDALQAIPTLSIVINENDWSSLNSNPRSGQEESLSLELIYPQGPEGFQVDCGIQVMGGASRGQLKKSYRLLFKGIFGPATLDFPWFGPDAASEFNTIALRAAFNDGYAWGYEPKRLYEQYARDEFIRVLQRDMSHVSPNSMFVHLYINGVYWGLYNPCERPDASFSASYFGGEEEDWDSFSHDGLEEGNSAALNDMMYLTQLASDSYEAYQQLQGNYPDGTRNPNYPILLDMTNYVDYLLLNYYTGNGDWPWNNFWYGRKRTADSTGFKFYCWDSEIALGLPAYAMHDSHLYTNKINDYRQIAQFHGNLVDNYEYRLFFADRVHNFMFNDGILTPEYTGSCYLDIASQIELPMIGESARWGDMHFHPPRSQDDWYYGLNWLLETYFPQRYDIVLQQLKDAGLYPNIDAPVFYINASYQHGGQMATTDELSMLADADEIYYTLDGSDPRLPGVSEPTVNTTTILFENARKAVLVPTGPIGDNWNSNINYNDSSWISGTGGVGYEVGSGYQAFFNIDLREQMYNGNTSCYIRIPFTFDGSTSDFNLLRLHMRYDDGFIAYLNGTEVARANAPIIASWNSIATASNPDDQAVIFESFDISSYLSHLREGQNILAIQGLNVANSSDFLISTELLAGQSIASSENDVSPFALRYSGPLTLEKSTNVKARALDGSTWSALNQTNYAVGPIAENLRITEIMYHPDDTGDPNEEFIELQNIGSDTINLNLVRFTNGINFTFPDMNLASGQYTLVVKDLSAFNARYGFNLNIAGEYSGSLDDGGERIRLEDAAGQTILNFRYNDNWYGITDGGGFSLTPINPAVYDPNGWSEKDFWRASALPGGSPEWDDDTGIIPNPRSVVINELLANSPDGEPDWIELYNATDEPINIGGWFLSDSSSDLTRYKIAEGTTIAAGGYLVFYDDLHFNNEDDPGCDTPFVLSLNGETVYLSSSLDNILTGYRERQDFSASEADISFGRYYKISTGNYNFVAMSQSTPGLENAYPKVGPIVINEIMYNPALGYQSEEYIELHNISSEAITLYDYEKNAPWKFTDGIGYTLPVDQPVTIPAGGYLLIVKDPLAFVMAYGVMPDGIEVLGPYNGQLSNSGEKLELGMPGEVDDLDGRFYIRVDRISYSDGLHPENCPGGIDLWPLEADGDGLSLSRKSASLYGNEVDNWRADVPSPALSNQ